MNFAQKSLLERTDVHIVHLWTDGKVNNLQD